MYKHEIQSWADYEIFAIENFGHKSKSIFGLKNKKSYEVNFFSQENFKKKNIKIFPLWAKITNFSPIFY